MRKVYLAWEIEARRDPGGNWAGLREKGIRCVPGSADTIFRGHHVSPVLGACALYHRPTFLHDEGQSMVSVIERFWTDPPHLFKNYLDGFMDSVRVSDSVFVSIHLPGC